MPNVVSFQLGVPFAEPLRPETGELTFLWIVVLDRAAVYLKRSLLELSTRDCVK
jgi:hypothetical protein